MLALHNLAVSTGLIVGKTLVNQRQRYTAPFFLNSHAHFDLHVDPLPFF